MSFGVALDPLQSLLDSLLKGGLLLIAEFVLQFLVLKRSSDRVAVVLQSVLGFNSLSDILILLLVFLRLVDHLLDLLLGKSSLVVGNDNLVGFTGGLILGVDVQDTVGIDIESNLNLGNTSGGGGDTIKIEFT
mmetsp:Transcript_111395/g.156382  ORF Transcript_111395/g.156382 Transcript_111395/m.156382 type:complete len:133 (+) Transcript_111395:329-727(+)